MPNIYNPINFHIVIGTTTKQVFNDDGTKLFWLPEYITDQDITKIIRICHAAYEQGDDDGFNRAKTRLMNTFDLTERDE